MGKHSDEYTYEYDSFFETDNGTMSYESSEPPKKKSSKSSKKSSKRHDSSTSSSRELDLKKIVSKKPPKLEPKSKSKPKTTEKNKSDLLTGSTPIQKGAAPSYKTETPKLVQKPTEPPKVEPVQKLTEPPKVEPVQKLTEPPKVEPVQKLIEPPKVEPVQKPTKPVPEQPIQKSTQPPKMSTSLQPKKDEQPVKKEEPNDDEYYYSDYYSDEYDYESENERMEQLGKDLIRDKYNLETLQHIYDNCIARCSIKDMTEAQKKFLDVVEKEIQDRKRARQTRGRK